MGFCSSPGPLGLSSLSERQEGRNEVLSRHLDVAEEDTFVGFGSNG